MFRCVQSFMGLLYPALCLSCRSSLLDQVCPFCPDCLAELVLIDASDRCRYCFGSLGGVALVCRRCRERASLIRGYAAAFEEMGPAASLLKYLKQPNGVLLAPGAAGFMVHQYLKLNFPIPDLIVPVPLAFTSWLLREFNQSEALAAAVGQILNRPILSALKRSSGGWRQRGLSYSQRAALSRESFYLEHSKEIQERTVLLVDDTYHSGATLQRCAETLSQGFPDQIFGLTLCRSSPCYEL